MALLMLNYSVVQWHCKDCDEKIIGKSSGFDPLNANIMALKHLEIYKEEHLDSVFHKEIMFERQIYEKEIVAYING